MSSVYLDYNATTPVDSEVVDAISKSLIEDWGNPSSGHERGLIARKKIEIAREHLAKVMCVKLQFFPELINLRLSICI